MVINTSRFGKVEITNDDLFVFSEGLLGFSDFRNFVLLDDPNDEIFAWLQSCEVPEVAFPVLEPEIFVPDYNPQIAKKDLEILKVGVSTKLRCFTIITIPDDPTQMTANLKAPIVINASQRIARQCVLSDNSLAIREPIFGKLQQRVFKNPAASIKGATSEWGVAVVKLPAKAPERSPETSI